MKWRWHVHHWQVVCEKGDFRCTLKHCRTHPYGLANELGNVINSFEHDTKWCVEAACEVRSCWKRMSWKRCSREMLCCNTCHPASSTEHTAPSRAQQSDQREALPSLLPSLLGREDTEFSQRIVLWIKFFCDSISWIPDPPTVAASSWARSKVVWREWISRTLRNVLYSWRWTVCGTIHRCQQAERNRLILVDISRCKKSKNHVDE